MNATPPAGIFKAYDIRGLYGSEMDGDTAYLIGRAFARVLADLRDKATGDLRVGLGRDMRIEAPEMASRVREGLVDEGCSVVDAGMVGTEMLYFLVGSRELDGGAMVTASHNPKAYTGVKLVREGALAFSGDAGIGEVRAAIEAGLPEPPGGGSVSEVDIYDEFHEHALRSIDPSAIRPLRVVVDGGNGMAGPMVGPLLERLGLELSETYWTPDGEFPDHEPNPLLPENREFIIERVRSEGADLGIAWDGDADRCFFIDDRGEFVDGDFLTTLLAAQVLSREPGATILYDVRASRAVPETVARLGGTSQVNRVGHAFFKIGMREHGGAFGGEVSGPLLLPGVLVGGLRHASRPAGPRTALEGVPPPLGAGRGAARQVLHQRRDQLRGRQSAGEDGGDRSRARGRGDLLAGRRIGRLPGLALQRSALEHRAAAPAQSGIAGVA